MMNKRCGDPVLGFIGTGAITQAVVTGFCSRAADLQFPIVLSPRNAQTAARLKTRYPDRVTVAQTMQQVLDQSDWVVLAVPPQAAQEVCCGLRFRPDHTVISLLPDKSLSEITSWIGPTHSLVHLVPLTFNAVFDGPILLCPPQARVAAMFGRIGRVIEVEDSGQADSLSAVTGCVTPMFAVMQSLISWLCDQNVQREQAADYVSRFFQAVCAEAVSLGPDEIEVMARESTPGGINLFAKNFIEQAGGFAAWQQAMTLVLQRVAGAAGQGEGPLGGRITK